MNVEAGGAKAGRGQRFLSGRRGSPLGALLVIGTLVLLAHLVLLQALPAVPLATKPPMKAFTTRTLVLDAPKPEAAPLPKPTPKPPKPRQPPRKPRPAVPTPTPPAPLPVAPSEVALSTPEAAPGESAAPPASSEPVTTAPAPAAADAATQPAGPTPVPPPRETPVGARLLAIPGSAQIKYDVEGDYKRNHYTASAQLMWLQDGTNYDAILEVKAFLLLSFSQMSSGQITSEGLAPLRFADKRRSEVAAHFERDKGKVTFSANTPDAPLLSGAQDRLSVIMQLVAMLAGEPDKYPPATTITLPIVGPRDAEVWLFTVDGEETLNLAGGPLQAVKVSRNPRKEFDQKIEVWFAPSLGYLPVRVRITQANGDFVDQKMTEVEKR